MENKETNSDFFYGFVCPQKKIYFAKGFAIHSRNLSNFQNMYRTFLGGYHSTTILSGAQHPPEQQNGNSYITTVNFIFVNRLRFHCQNNLLEF